MLVGGGRGKARARFRALGTFGAESFGGCRSLSRSSAGLRSRREKTDREIKDHRGMQQTSVQEAKSYSTGDIGILMAARVYVHDYLIDLQHEVLCTDAY